MSNRIDIKKIFQERSAKYDLRVFVNDKTEYYFLVEQNKPLTNSIKTVRTNMGRTTVNYLYENDFEGFTAFLIEDSEIVVRGILDNPYDVSLWMPFFTRAIQILELDDSHPFYMVFLKDVFNFYESVKHKDPSMHLYENHFKKLGISYASLHKMIADYLKFYDLCSTNLQVAQAILNSDLSSVHYFQMRTEISPEINNSHNLQKTFWPVLCPQLPEDIWHYLMPLYLESNIWFKRCQNCKRYFVTTMQSNARFCERVFNERGRTCRQLMTKINHQIKSQSNPADWLFNRAYKTMYSRVSAGFMSKEAYKEWSKEAREKRNACTEGLITPEDYSTWLCDNGLQIDYLKY